MRYRVAVASILCTAILAAAVHGRAFAQPIAGGPGTKIVVKMLHESKFPQHNIGRFRLSLTTAAKPSLSETGLPADIVEKIKSPGGREELQEQYARLRQLIEFG